MPRIAFATARAMTSAVEPATCRPSRPNATAEVRSAWTVATAANAIP